MTKQKSNEIQPLRNPTTEIVANEYILNNQKGEHVNDVILELKKKLQHLHLKLTE